MKAWHLPLLVAEGVLALLVTNCTGESRTQSGSVVGATRATLIVRDDDGRTTRAHMVRSDVRITLNGEPALLDDLRIGDRVAISLVDEDGMSVVRSIAAHSVRNQLNRLPSSANANSPATGPLANVATFE
jgi:hypothetical protein